MPILRLILDVDNRDGSQQRVWMNLNEVLRIGRSSSADVCIASDFQLADHHFSIVGAADGWQLQASPGARVGVNGQLQQRCLLGHGDRIIAGETEFQVTIERPTQLEPTTAVVAQSVAAAERVKATCNRLLCDSGVVKFEVTLNESLLTELLEQARGQSSLVVAINTQQLGMQKLNGPLSAITPATEDLFAQAPDEIRASDSLFLGSLPLEATIVSNVQKASSSDGALILITPLPIEELVAQQKFVWAWFARPSIIDQQLRVGSKHLAEKLLAAVETVVLLNINRCDVVLYTRSDTSEELAARLASI